MRLLHIALIGFLLTSCAALEPPKRWTENNVFYSSNSPRLQFEVPDEFKYIGEFDGDYMVGRTLDKSDKAKAKRVLYNFGVIGDNNLLKKLYQINIETLSGNQWWTPWTADNTMLMHGIIKQGAERYPYGIRNRFNVGNLTSQYLIDKEILSPSCLLSLSATRRYGSNNNVRMHIHYMEDVSDYSEYDIESCKDWNKVSSFNDKQKNFLVSFETRAKGAIQLLPYSPPNIPQENIQETAQQNRLEDNKLSLMGFTPQKYYMEYTDEQQSEVVALCVSQILGTHKMLLRNVEFCEKILSSKKGAVMVREIFLPSVDGDQEQVDDMLDLTLVELRRRTKK